MGKKGQAAMEYLMTYGWAILVVLIALGALYFLGVFETQVQNQCRPIPPISTCDLKLTASGGQISTSYTSTTATDVKLTALKLNEGAEKTCTATALTSGTPTTFTCAHGLTAGTKYSGTAKISYKGMGGVDHTVNVVISGQVE